MLAGGAVILGIVTYLLVPSTVESSANSHEQKTNTPLIQNNNDEDGNLIIELLAEGLEHPTSMRFIGANNILILQKNDGQVRLVSNGVLYEKPVLTVNNLVSDAERGLLDIAVW